MHQKVFRESLDSPFHSTFQTKKQSAADKNIEYQIGKLETVAKLKRTPVSFWRENKHSVTTCHGCRRKSLQRKPKFSEAMKSQSDCWKYDIDRCWRKIIFRKLFSQRKRSSNQLDKRLKSQKTCLGQKLDYLQCNHVERRNPGSKKYQSVLPELAG